MATSPWHILIVLVLLAIPLVVIGAIVYAVVKSNRRRSTLGVQMHQAPVPGWYPDPGSPVQFRWFDGVRWTDATAPTGVVPPSAQ